MVDGLYGTIHTPYAVFSDDMYDGITEVKKQVKDTTMILNSIASGDNVCASADYQKNRGKILDTGISLYEYMGKHSTHGKSIVIDDDIAVPFVNRKDGYRVDRVDVHAALGEAVANALAHSNYYERRGVVVVKKGKEITISNPGTIRITKEEFYAGGNSDPRNPNILKMFGFVNVGERAGSGVDKIMTAWKEQNWKKPEFDFSVRADRVTLKLEVGQVVYIPGAADLRVEDEYIFETLPMTKQQNVLEYIAKYGSISSQVTADICGYKSKSGARKLLDKMIEEGQIKKIGKGPSTHYVIN